MGFSVAKQDWKLHMFCVSGQCYNLDLGVMAGFEVGGSLLPTRSSLKLGFVKLGFSTSEDVSSERKSPQECVRKDIRRQYMYYFQKEPFQTVHVQKLLIQEEWDRRKKIEMSEKVQKDPYIVALKKLNQALEKLPTRKEISDQEKEIIKKFWKKKCNQGDVYYCKMLGA